MAENTHIEWATHTFNTHWGCTKVSAGCKNCYAETLSNRYGNSVWGPTAARKPMSEKYWRQLELWNKKAEMTAEHPRIFCNSMSDLFEGPETCRNAEAYAVVVAARERLFQEIDRTPNLRYLLLTKRPENMIAMAPEHWENGWPSHVMAGTSVEGQEAAYQRIPFLLEVPAWQHFLSIEPLLGPVDLTSIPWDGYELNALKGQARGRITRDIIQTAKLDWVIVGGESGPGARPMHLEWARQLRDSCNQFGVEFLFKQWGEWSPTNQIAIPEKSVPYYSPPGDCVMLRVGKKAAGRFLDGRTWDEVPEVVHD